MLCFINKSNGKRYISHNYLTRRKLPRMIHFAYKAVWSGIDHTVNLMVQFAAFVIAARLFVFTQNEWKQRKLILTINLFLLETFCHPMLFLFFRLEQVRKLNKWLYTRETLVLFPIPWLKCVGCFPLEHYTGSIKNATCILSEECDI